VSEHEFKHICQKYYLFIYVLNIFNEGKITECDVKTLVPCFDMQSE